LAVIKSVKGLKIGAPVGFVVGLIAARSLLVGANPEFGVNLAVFTLNYFDLVGAVLLLGILFKPIRKFANQHIVASYALSGFVVMGSVTTHYIAPVLAQMAG
jgi:hypothetical protein